MNPLPTFAITPPDPAWRARLSAQPQRTKRSGWRSPVALAGVWVRVAVGAVLILGAMAGTASAAMSDPEPGEPPWLTQARESLRAQRFEQAAQALQAAQAVDVAEWHNLLGYALRKKSPPDLVAAERHYQRALEIAPRHRHAMEYYGELFLMKGDLAGAEAMLKRLDKACFFGCEEYDELKRAIARFKAQAGRK